MVIRGVLCGGSVGLNIVGRGGVGGAGFATGFVTGLVVTGMYLVVSFGVGRVVGLDVVRVVGPGVGRAVGLVTGLSVTKASTHGGLRGCSVILHQESYWLYQCLL